MATLRVAAKPEVAPNKVAQISKPGGDFEIVERAIPEPGAGQVRIRVQACGVCHSDVLTKEGTWPECSIPVYRGTKLPASLMK
jgi:D-arabinose 1-dehydrogenase-like Zn-dependent alcohol dehydrogenase